MVAVALAVSIIQSLGLAVLCLARKQPYHACCELAMPWRALLRLRGAWRAHARLRRQSKVTLKSLSTLSANHRQVREWLDRRRALRDQRDVVLLSPLEKDHLRKRLLRRWGLAFGAAADCRHMDSRAVLGRASFRMFGCVDVFRTAVAHGRELHPVASYRDHVMVVCLRHGHQCA